MPKENSSAKRTLDPRLGRLIPKPSSIRIVAVPMPQIARPEVEAEAVDAFLAHNGAAWKLLGAQFGDLRMTRLISASTRKKVREIVARIRKSKPAYRWPAYADYLFVEASADTNGAALVRKLRGWKDVQEAYLCAESSAPGIVVPRPGNRYDPHYGDQFYLRAAPQGIGAEPVWDRLGGQTNSGVNGYGAALVDMENGFNPDHEDLTSHFQPQGANPRNPISGLNDVTEAYHGTAVLGIICAGNNSLGCCGIVPGLSHVALASTADADANGLTELPRADVLSQAVEYLAGWPGSVILIEHELQDVSGIPYGTPVELQPPDYEAIQLACDAGCIGIEPAGNGGLDLDCDVPPSSPDINLFHSGAIMVGASGVQTTNGGTPLPGDVNVVHSPLNNSDGDQTNVGSRFDCFAPGERLRTCDVLIDYNNGSVVFRNDDYRDDFGCTSGASAIIAGVALSVQGMVLARYGTTLKPDRLRRLLKNPQFCTSSKNGLQDRIGVMPDLDKIERALQNLNQSPLNWLLT